jgi:AcrR family transcriptional regulator
MSARKVAEPVEAGGDGNGRKAGNSAHVARTNEAGAETRRRLLDVAERLFATRGLDAVSLRDITETAGANMAAVHYHFGSKQELITALVERRSGAIGKRRNSLLDELEKSPTLDLRSVVRAIVLPTAEMVAEEGGGAYYVAFLATLGDHPEVTPTLLSAYGAYTRRLLRLLAKVTPELPDDVRLLRWSIAGDLVNRLLGYPTGQVRHWLAQLRPGADAHLVDSLTDIVEGIFIAPVTVSQRRRRSATQSGS